MKPRITSVFIVLILLALFLSAEEQSATDGKEMSVKSLVQKLGSRSYRERVEAENQLKEFDKSAITELEPYLKSDDPEIRIRVNNVVNHLKEKFKPPINEGEVVMLPSGLKYIVLSKGKGDSSVANGDRVEVHYTGWLEDGTKFDSSLDRDRPFVFQVGKGMVIRGWEEGILKMKANEKRKLIIPPNLGYGKRGAGAVIPPDATLVFEVEVIGF